MPFLPVDYDPFDGDPEATAAAAASQAMQPATQPFVDLAGSLANTLAVQPVLSAYNTTDRVLSGQGFTPEEALNAAGLAFAGSTGRGGLGAGPRLSLRTTDAELNQHYPLAGETVDSRVVRPDVPNESSIGASFTNPEVLPGIRDVPMSYFDAPGADTPRARELASQISQSGEVNPLIVAHDNEGPYILEGANRFDALKQLGANSFPAKVVLDTDSLPEWNPIITYHGTPATFAPEPGYPLGRFSDDFIGTGEGAQAYSYGHYTAENPGVGREYRERLAGEPDILHWSVGSIPIYRNGQPVDYSPRNFDPASIAKASLQEQMMIAEQQFRDVAHDPDQLQQLTSNIVGHFARDPGYEPASLAYYNRVLNQVNNGTMPVRFQYGPQPGNLYQVAIHADPDSFLHWDKPLSEQSPQVTTALDQLLPRSAEPMAPGDLLNAFLDSSYAKSFPDVSDVRAARRVKESPDYPEEVADWAAKQNNQNSSAYNLFGPVGSIPQTSTGSQLYGQVIARYGDEPAAAKALKGAGLSGVKYLDQGSRPDAFDIYKTGDTWNFYDKKARQLKQFPTQEAANQFAESQMTHNYVVFDPRMMEILKKYGLGGLIAGGAMTLGGNADAATHAVPVEHDPFADLPGSTGDPEAAGAVAASQAFQPALAGHLSGVGSDLTDWATRQAAMNSRLQGQPLAAQALDPEALDSAQAIALGTGPGAIRAYHGSPHDFSAFDSNRIGTGEGAQAYGQGLYFAENPGVAASYQDRLSHPARVQMDQTPLPYINGKLFEPQNHSIMQIAQSSRDPAIVRGKLENYVNESGSDNPYAHTEDAQHIIDAIDAGTYHNGLPGRMYEVGINADPESFLHWDEPLANQPDHVRQAVTNALAPSGNALDYWRGRLQDDFDQNGPGGYSQPRFDRAINEAIAHGGYGDEFGNRVWGEIHEAAPEVGPEFTDFMQRHGVGIDPSDTGRQAYSLLTDKHSNEAAASQALLENGIPGIKYLDQQSRNAAGWHIIPSHNSVSGKWIVKSSDYNSKGMQFDTEAEAQQALQDKIGSQTHNYVMFDDKMIDILRKYGLAGLVAGGAMTLGGNSQAATHALPVDSDPFGTGAASPF